MRNDHDQPVELALSLTTQAITVLDMLAGPSGLQPEHSPQSLALHWIARWARSSGKGLWCPDAHVLGTETMTVSVNRPLLPLLRNHGLKRGWEPEEMASVIVNDCAAHMSS